MKINYNHNMEVMRRCAPVCVVSQGVLSLSNRMKLALMELYPSEMCTPSHTKLMYVCTCAFCVMRVHLFLLKMLV